jgi:hypothetical protein
MIVRVLGAFVLLYAAYLGSTFLQAQTFVTVLWMVWALVCGLGLLVHRSWAAYLWYGLALFTSVSWIWALVGVVRSGWPYSDAFRSAISLLPGVCILAICGFGSVAVARQFRRLSTAESSSS